MACKKNRIMATTKLFLDKRSGNAPYPLKLTITHERKAVHLSLGVRLHPEQWDGVKVVKHPRAGMLNNQLIARKSDIDSKLFEWRAKIKGKSVTEVKRLIEADEKGEPLGGNVTFGVHFMKYAQMKTGQTYKGYMYTYATLKKYCDIDSVTFEEITVKWLEAFDRWCTHSRNTKCIHYRYMRATFNDAIDEDLTTNYPFRKFKIKTEETKDRSLTLEQLRTLFSWPVEEHQVKYVDMFKLIFLLRGINLVDLCRMTAQNVQKGRIIYKRSKTKKNYSIKIEPEIQELLDKYRGENYLIDILDKYADYKSYMSHINKELKRIGTVKGRFGLGGKKEIVPLFPKLSTYWARHTFAYIAKNECDISLDMISDILGHSYGMAVTNVYVRKSDDKIDAAARKVIDKVLYDK